MHEGTPIIIKKKKGHGHGGHHGGSWKVAYADFVTAMMAFFMVMWIMGLSDSTKASIQGYFNDPLGFTKNQPKAKVNLQPVGGGPRLGKGDASQASKEDQEAQAIERLKKEIERTVRDSSDGSPEYNAIMKGLQLSVTSEGLQLELVESAGLVFFELGSADIRPVAKKLIHSVAPVLAKCKRKLFVDGHTDAKPFKGSGMDNMDLSLMRASSVRRALLGGGVADRQIEGTRGFGPKRLKDPDNPYSFVNRRVTVLIPYNLGADADVKLPKEMLEEDIQGAFRSDINIKPANPKLAEQH